MKGNESIPKGILYSIPERLQLGDPLMNCIEISMMNDLNNDQIQINKGYLLVT